MNRASGSSLHPTSPESLSRVVGQDGSHIHLGLTVDAALGQHGTLGRSLIATEPRLLHL